MLQSHLKHSENKVWSGKGGGTGATGNIKSKHKDSGWKEKKQKKKKKTKVTVYGGGGLQGGGSRGQPLGLRKGH